MEIIYIRGLGYYSLYGLTVYCTSFNSICIIDCYGNSCVGSTMICGDSTLTCDYKCSDSECETYQIYIKLYTTIILVLIVIAIIIIMIKWHIWLTVF